MPRRRGLYQLPDGLKNMQARWDPCKHDEDHAMGMRTEAGGMMTSPTGSRTMWARWLSCQRNEWGPCQRLRGMRTVPHGDGDHALEMKAVPLGWRTVPWGWGPCHEDEDHTMPWGWGLCHEDEDPAMGRPAERGEGGQNPRGPATFRGPAGPGRAPNVNIVNIIWARDCSIWEGPWRLCPGARICTRWPWPWGWGSYHETMPWGWGRCHGDEDRVMRMRTSQGWGACQQNQDHCYANRMRAFQPRRRPPCHQDKDRTGDEWAHGYIFSVGKALRNIYQFHHYSQNNVLQQTAFEAWTSWNTNSLNFLFYGYCAGYLDFEVHGWWDWFLIVTTDGEPDNWHVTACWDFMIMIFIIIIMIIMMIRRNVLKIIKRK